VLGRVVANLGQELIVVFLCRHCLRQNNQGPAQLWSRFPPGPSDAVRTMRGKQQILVHNSRSDNARSCAIRDQRLSLEYSPISLRGSDLPAFFRGMSHSRHVIFRALNLFPRPHVQDRHTREISWLSFRNSTFTNQCASRPVLLDQLRTLSH
jgi:hypothetical protein